jgi:ketosteroid isomerase-like protein
MSDQNLDVVKGAYEAFSRGDVPAVLGVLADDIEWKVPPPLPQAAEVHGRDEVDDFVASGDRVCVIGRGSGNVDGSPAGYGFVHCWTLSGGRATRFDEYAAPGDELL